MLPAFCFDAETASRIEALNIQHIQAVEWERQLAENRLRQNEQAAHAALALQAAQWEATRKQELECHYRALYESRVVEVQTIWVEQQQAAKEVSTAPLGWSEASIEAQVRDHLASEVAASSEKFRSLEKELSHTHDLYMDLQQKSKDDAQSINDFRDRGTREVEALRDELSRVRDQAQLPAPELIALKSELASARSYITAAEGESRAKLWRTEQQMAEQFALKERVFCQRTNC